MNNTELMEGCTLAPYWWDDVPRPHLPDQPLPPTIDVAVVGAGLAGLTAARALKPQLWTEEVKKLPRAWQRDVLGAT